MNKQQERRQLELLGLEQQEQLPTPMRLRTMGGDVAKLLLLIAFSIIALNIASVVIDRELHLQQQQKAGMVK
jgi:hypothetical protein